MNELPPEMPHRQLTEHVPPLHTWPAGQSLLQVPQLRLSVWRLTQVPLHTARPCWQESAQLPPASEQSHVPAVWPDRMLH